MADDPHDAHARSEFSVFTLFRGATTDIIGAAEAKGMRLVALHAAAKGTAVVAFCTRKGAGATLTRLLPPSGCFRVYQTAAEAQHAVQQASGGGASLCFAANEATDANGAARDRGSCGGGDADAGVSGSGAAGRVTASHSDGGADSHADGGAADVHDAASAASTSIGLAGLHACAEESGTHHALLALLRSHGTPFSTLEHVAVRTSEEAASVRGVPLASGAKAMLLALKPKGAAAQELVLAVTAADRRMDSALFKQVARAKSTRFATEDEVRAVTRCVPGAVPPFGSLWGLRTYLDRSLQVRVRITARVK